MEQVRKERALDQTFIRERQSLRTAQQREHEINLRRGHDHMPALNLTLGPPGRKAAPHKAMRRYTAPTAKEINVKARPPAEQEPLHTRDDFSFSAKPPSPKRTNASKKPDADRGGKKISGRTNDRRRPGTRWRNAA